MATLVHAGVLSSLLVASAFAAEAPSLSLERRIPLGKVDGRMDHFAVDRKRQRLFLAELGNDTVSVIDLQGATVAHRLTDIDEPQGLAFAGDLDMLYVGSGGDGTVRAYRADDFSLVAEVDLGDDTDNLRLDAATGTLYAGYGSGGLAALDAKTLAKKVDFPLKDHPESFQLDPAGDRIFVNVPNSHEIVVLSRKTGRQVATWPVPYGANFPMAVRADGSQVLAVFRSPARLVSFDSSDGKVMADVPTCADADDVFIDEKRSAAYVACGDGSIDAVSLIDGELTPKVVVQTSRGARTAYYDAVLDRLFLAVREVGATPAGVWAFRPK